MRSPRQLCEEVSVELRANQLALTPSSGTFASLCAAEESRDLLHDGHAHNEAAGGEDDLCYGHIQLWSASLIYVHRRLDAYR